MLAERVLADLSHSAGRRIRGFAPDAIALIRRYAWPGNVRELRNAVERAITVGEGPWIEVTDLPDLVVAAAPADLTSDDNRVTLPANLRWLEKKSIDAALRATHGNQRKAALVLGINRVTLNRKLRDAKDSEPQD